MEDYDISNETVKECLSHQNIMKLHRCTSHENDVHINDHNLCQMMSNMMTYMSCMKIFVYAAETA